MKKSLMIPPKKSTSSNLPDINIITRRIGNFIILNELQFWAPPPAFPGESMLEEFRFLKEIEQVLPIAQEPSAKALIKIGDIYLKTCFLHYSRYYPKETRKLLSNEPGYREPSVLFEDVLNKLNDPEIQEQLLKFEYRILVYQVISDPLAEKYPESVVHMLRKYIPDFPKIHSWGERARALKICVIAYKFIQDPHEKNSLYHAVYDFIKLWSEDPKKDISVNRNIASIQSSRSILDYYSVSHPDLDTTIKAASIAFGETLEYLEHSLLNDCSGIRGLYPLVLDAYEEVSHSFHLWLDDITTKANAEWLQMTVQARLQSILDSEELFGKLRKLIDLGEKIEYKAAQLRTDTSILNKLINKSMGLLRVFRVLILNLEKFPSMSSIECQSDPNYAKVKALQHSTFEYCFKAFQKANQRSNWCEKIPKEQMDKILLENDSILNYIQQIPKDSNQKKMHAYMQLWFACFIRRHLEWFSRFTNKPGSERFNQYSSPECLENAIDILTQNLKELDYHGEPHFYDMLNQLASLTRDTHNRQISLKFEIQHVFQLVYNYVSTSNKKKMAINEHAQLFIDKSAADTYCFIYLASNELNLDPVFLETIFRKAQANLNQKKVFLQSKPDLYCHEEHLSTFFEVWGHLVKMEWMHCQKTGNTESKKLSEWASVSNNYLVSMLAALERASTKISSISGTWSLTYQISSNLMFSFIEESIIQYFNLQQVKEGWLLQLNQYHKNIIQEHYNSLDMAKKNNLDATFKKLINSIEKVIGFGWQHEKKLYDSKVDIKPLLDGHQKFLDAFNRLLTEIHRVYMVQAQTQSYEKRLEVKKAKPILALPPAQKPTPKIIQKRGNAPTGFSFFELETELNKLLEQGYKEYKLNLHEAALELYKKAFQLALEHHNLEYQGKAMYLLAGLAYERVWYKQICCYNFINTQLNGQYCTISHLESFSRIVQENEGEYLQILQNACHFFNTQPVLTNPDIALQRMNELNHLTNLVEISQNDLREYIELRKIEYQIGCQDGKNGCGVKYCDDLEQLEEYEVSQYIYCKNILFYWNAPAKRKEDIRPDAVVGFLREFRENVEKLNPEQLKKMCSITGHKRQVFFPKKQSTGFMSKRNDLVESIDTEIHNVHKLTDSCILFQRIVKLPPKIQIIFNILCNLTKNPDENVRLVGSSVNHLLNKKPLSSDCDFVLASKNIDGVLKLEEEGLYWDLKIRPIGSPFGFKMHKISLLHPEHGAIEFELKWIKLEEDCWRKDFESRLFKTELACNRRGMVSAYTREANELLKNKKLAPPIDPKQYFLEDPVRILINIAKRMDGENTNIEAFDEALSNYQRPKNFAIHQSRVNQSFVKYMERFGNQNFLMEANKHKMLEKLLGVKHGGNWNATIKAVQVKLAETRPQPGIWAPMPDDEGAPIGMSKPELSSGGLKK